MTLCKCGCGQQVKGKRVFVNKEHQLAWMFAGGAKEMNALQPLDAKQQGGRTTGQEAALSGRLKQAGLKGAAVSRAISERFKNEGR